MGAHLAGAQLNPIDNGLACRNELKNASGVCPDKVRPERSVMVPDTMTGSRTARSSNTASTANSAAFALRVSKIVSTSRMSAPPSIRPRICSA
jgi:hypothetical protein